jgi:predicted secreted protein
MKSAFALLAIFASAGAIAETVVYSPSAKQQKVRVGDTFVVRLEALPGAGYVWQVKPGGHSNLKLRDTETERGRTGIGGKQRMVFSFEATAKGWATLTMVYGRPWLLNKGGKPEKTRKIDVHVLP